jgi:Tol biopolymer transport system component
VAFSSLGDNLVSGDTNHAQDVFVRDMQAGVTVLASLNSASTGPGNGDSYSPILSADGQFVLFRSRAGNLIPGMTAGTENLFWRDLALNQSRALTTNGIVAASMTRAGSMVAYITSSSKLSPASDWLYLWDSQSNAIVYSLAGPRFSTLAISSDGQRLAYVTNVSGVNQLTVLDRASGANLYVISYRASTAPPHFDSTGRFLVYSGAVGTGTGPTQVYLVDLETGTNLLVSRTYDTASLGDGDSDSAEVSAGARFVAFRSSATNLVPGDNNGLPDVFLFDTVNRVTTLVSASRFGTGSADNRSLSPSFSPDGRSLAFVSWATDLVPNDFNGFADVFTLRLEAGTSLPSFALNVFPGSISSTYTWLVWPAVSGRGYRVQYKDQLGDPTWQELGGAVSILGDQGYLKATRTQASRFYRVIAF